MTLLTGECQQLQSVANTQSFGVAEGRMRQFTGIPGRQMVREQGRCLWESTSTLVPSRLSATQHAECVIDSCSWIGGRSWSACNFCIWMLAVSWKAWVCRDLQGSSALEACCDVRGWYEGTFCIWTVCHQANSCSRAASLKLSHKGCCSAGALPRRSMPCAVAYNVGKMLSHSRLCRTHTS